MAGVQNTPNQGLEANNGSENTFEIFFPGTHIFQSNTPLLLDSGQTLPSFKLAYETYGTLNEKKDNAILLCHALSGSSHVFQGTAQPPVGGWWDPMGDSGAAFDPAKYFIICVNILGSCYGSSGPASIDPETGEPYGTSFPVVTVSDIVRAEKVLVDSLGIEKLLAVAGGSLGGMQALTWATEYPDRVAAAIPIATSCQSSAQNIAFNEVGRQAIIADPHWNNGNYYGQEAPESGLAIARMIGHITYLSETSMRDRFGRRLENSTSLGYEFDTDFAVESYLKYKGFSFTKRFDANAYLYISKSIDYFDLTRGGERSLTQAFRHVKAKFLVLSYSSDWLYPPRESKCLMQALKANNIDVSYCNIESNYGHDAFLLESETQNRLIGNFLKNLTTKNGACIVDDNGPAS
ncbi:MAG TPA: homoserine O-acetyltransferase [Candidatus Lokiarchaeia archaeon]|nr:homoserine O-acetyltransferase [Candidatus Lokiarchaeia archaeon]